MDRPVPGDHGWRSERYQYGTLPGDTTGPARDWPGLFCRILMRSGYPVVPRDSTYLFRNASEGHKGALQVLCDEYSIGEYP